MSEHDLNTPGGMIRNRREEKKLSLADLSERTKIPAPVLEAVEHNEFHKVSGALYIKSFLRTCAAELGLEEDEVLAKYAQFSGEFETPSASGEGQWREEDVQISRIGLPWRLIGIVGAVVAGILVVFLLTVRGCGGGSNEAENARPVSESVVEEAELAQDSDLSNGPADVENGREIEEQNLIEEKDLSPKLENSSAGDSLSRSFVSSSEPSEVVAKTTDSAQTEPQSVKLEVQKENIVGAGPAVAVGNQETKFSGTEPRDVVLRIVSQTQVDIQVKRDAERSFSAVRWPGNLGNIENLPLQGIEAGRPYRVAEGFVVYWGAVDHFSLKLGSVRNVEVMLNGVSRNVSRLKPGGELVLDLHGN